MNIKKTLKIVGISIAAILVIMIALPFCFEGKVMELAKKEGNKLLNAKFDFESLSISLFKDFPNASLTLNNFYIVGNDAFSKDTLVCADEISVSVNIKSLFTDQYQIGRVAIDDATVHLITLADSTVNWDIMKPDTTAVTETEEQPAAFDIKLQKLAINNLNLTYDDYAADMHASIVGFSSTLTGNFADDETEMQLKAATRALTFQMGLIPYLNNAELEADINLLANLKDMKFTLKDNSLRINAIKTSIDGWVQLTDSTRTDMDLKLNTNEISFKDVLSLIPAIYSKDFEQLQTNGEATLQATAKGSLVGDSLLPAFDMSLLVENASFRYPSLPAGVDNINVNMQLTNPGGDADNTVVNIKPLSFNMAGMPFAIQATVKTPISDPDFNVKADGTLNLSNIQKVYPLDTDTEFRGVLTAAVSILGRMSAIEREQYDKIQASGKLGLQDLTLNMASMQPVQVKQSTLTFTPKNVQLSQTEALIGNNDITLSGTLSNYLAYALKDDMLQGNVSISSNNLNLNDFMDSTTVASADQPEEAMGVIEVPKNVDLSLNANLKKVVFGTMNFANVAGTITVKDGTLRMQNLAMNTMGGSITANAAYSTAANVKQPTLDGAFKLNSLSFAETYKQLDMVKKLAPIFENLKGNFTGVLNLNTALDETLSPIDETMQGSGSIATSGINLSGIDVLNKVATIAKKGDLLAQNVKDLNLAFTIANGNLSTNPFTLKLGDYSMQLAGTTGILNQAIDYTGTIALPQAAQQLVQSLALKIGGTFTAPKISVDTKALADQAIDAVKDKALQAVSDKLGVDLTNAQAQKEALVAEARKASDKLVAEAQKQADKLVADAGGNLLKAAAAKVAGQALVKEAQKQADKLVAEAEAKGQALIDKLNQ